MSLELSTLHLQLPAGTRRPGGVFVAQRSRPSSSDHGLPSPSAFLPTRLRQPPQVGLLAELWIFTGCPSAPEFLSHWQESVPWVQGRPACTIWPGAKHLIARPPSQGFSG